MFEHFSPINDQLLIKVLPSESEQNGIIIPDTAKPKATFADVIAVGPGRTGRVIRCIDCKDLKPLPRLPLDVKPGDRIIFHPAVRSYMAREAEVDLQSQQETIIIREDSVLAVIEGS
jgi:co-chaperonin GroES (HSP10)